MVFGVEGAYSNMIENCKCPNCGAALSVFPSLNRATCTYCGSNFRYHQDLVPGSAQSTVADSPIGFTFEREETGRIKLLSDILKLQSVSNLPNNPYDRFIRFGIETYTGNRLFGTEGLEVRLISVLSTISGMAFSLKKTYSVEVDAGSFNRCDESEVRRKRKEYRRNRDSGRIIDNILKDNANKQQEHLNRKRLASSYGFDVRETVRGNEWIYQNWLHRTGLAIPATAIDVTCTLNITPDYFERYFPSIASVYSRVQNRDEVRLIVERLLPSAIQQVNTGVLNPWTINDIDMDSVVPVVGWEKPISYHELGMNNAPDLDTALAIRLSVISQLVEQSSDASGKYNWDLAPEYSPGSDLKLVPLARRVSQYNDW